ncbi:MAG: peptide chain release factor N(5)-glutamine methyltransferase [Oscillospiraceae bacterium]|nr:peptide chain release factor N(5)-glutamine methyltransferase [Oscillospiraceae bacterium]
MITVGEIYNNTKLLLKNISTDYSFEAKCILEKAFDSELPRILMNRNSEVQDNILEDIHNMTEKRKTGYPLQYILGEWEFYGYPFKIGEGVLIPRQDTETLVDYVLSYLKESEKIKNPRIMDLCSGSGCIAVSLKKEFPDAEIYALENSDDALKYLECNAKLNNANIHIIKADVLNEKYIESFCDKKIDIIVSNPPYLTKNDMKNLQKEVSFEPSYALYGGTDDGLYYYRKITEIWKSVLAPEGIIVYEIGINQHNDVSEILKLNNFNNIIFSKDTAEIIRVVSGKKQEVF